MVELLIVIIIIGILAAIAVPSISGARERAYVSEMQSDIRNGINYQLLHANDHAEGHFGTTVELEALGYTTSDRVTVDWVPEASNESYGVQATATHTSTDAECAMRYGTDGPAGQQYEGVVRCEPDGAVTWGTP